MEGFQDPYLFIESEQVTFSSKRHRCVILRVSADLSAGSWKAKKLQPVSNDNILSRTLGPMIDEQRYFKTRRSIFFFYTRYSRQGLLLTRFYAIPTYAHGGKYEECQGERDDSLKVLCSLNNTTFIVDAPDINLIGFERMYRRDFALRIIVETNLRASLPIEMFLISF